MRAWTTSAVTRRNADPLAKKKSPKAEKDMPATVVWKPGIDAKLR